METRGRGSVEHWQILAHVNQLVPCGEVFRHVADLAVDLIDLRDSAGLGDHHDWGMRCAAECVADRQTGRLQPDLEERIGRGVPQAVILRSILVAEPWRGQRLAELLLASILRFWARSARLALCRVDLEDFAGQCRDPLAAEFAAPRLVALWRDTARSSTFAWSRAQVDQLPSRYDQQNQT